MREVDDPKHVVDAAWGGLRDEQYVVRAGHRRLRRAPGSRRSIDEDPVGAGFAGAYDRLLANPRDELARVLFARLEVRVYERSVGRYRDAPSPAALLGQSHGSLGADVLADAAPLARDGVHERARAALGADERHRLEPARVHAESASGAPVGIDFRELAGDEIAARRFARVEHEVQVRRVDVAVCERRASGIAVGTRDRGERRGDEGLPAASLAAHHDDLLHEAAPVDVSRSFCAMSASRACSARNSSARSGSASTMGRPSAYARAIVSE